MFEFKCDREIQILDLYQNQGYESVAIEFYDDIIILERKMFHMEQLGMIPKRS